MSLQTESHPGIGTETRDNVSIQRRFQTALFAPF